MSPGEIQSLRKQLHLNQQDFANLIGVSYRTIQSWEQGLRMPSTPAVKIMRFLMPKQMKS